MVFSIIVLTKPSGGTMLDNWTYRAKGAQFTTAEHGFDHFSATIRMSRRDATKWLRRKGTPHIEITERAGLRVWEGRLEDVSVIPEGIKIAAYGYWRSYSDTKYTSLWIKTDYEGFTPMTDAQNAAYTPEQYDMTTEQGRIQITTKKGEVYANGTNFGELHWKAPHSGSKKIVYVNFTYETNVPSTFSIRLATFGEAYASGSVDWSLAGNGAVQTGTVTINPASKDFVAFGLYSTGAHTSTVDTGAHYFRITGLVIKVQSAAIYPEDVVKALITSVNAYNGANFAQLAFSGVLSNAKFFYSASWEDQLPADIIEEICSRGDNVNRRWEAKVWNDRVLLFQPVGTGGKRYFVDGGDIELNRSTELMYNAAYATLPDAAQDNRTIRTGLGTSPQSIASNGLTRIATVTDNSTNLADATLRRDNVIANSKDLTPRASLTIKRAFDKNGNIVPLYRIHSGDTVIVRGGNAAIEEDFAKFSQILLARTAFDLENRTIDVEPADPSATLVSILGGTY